MAHTQGPRRSDQPFGEFRQHRAMHDQARSGGAFLPRPAKGRVAGMGHGKVHVAVIHDDHGILRPHLHLQLRAIGQNAHRDALPYLDRSGKGYGGHVGMGDKGIAHGPPRPHHHVEGARRQPCPRNHLCQRDGRGRGQVGRLPYHRIAIGQRGRNFPCRRRHGKIPRRDYGHHPHRFAPHLDLYPRTDAFGLIALIAQRLGREPCEELARAIDLALAFSEGFALFTRQKGPDFA